MNHLLLLLFYLINFYKSYHAAPPPTFKNFEIFHSFHLESTPNFKIKSLKNPKFDTLLKLQHLHLHMGSHSQITRFSKQPSQGFISQKFLKNLEFQPLPMAAVIYKTVFDTTLKKMSVTTNNEFELSELMIWILFIYIVAASVLVAR